MNWYIRYIALLAWGGFLILTGIIFILTWGLAQGLAFLLFGAWSIGSTIAEMRGLTHRQIQQWYLMKGVTFLAVGLLLLATQLGRDSLLTAGGFLGLLYGGWCAFSSISQLRAMGRQ